MTQIDLDDFVRSNDLFGQRCLTLQSRCRGRSRARGFLARLILSIFLAAPAMMLVGWSDPSEIIRVAVTDPAPTRKISEPPILNQPTDPNGLRLRTVIPTRIAQNRSRSQASHLGHSRRASLQRIDAARIVFIADLPKSALSGVDAESRLANRKLTRKKSVYTHESEAEVREKIVALRRQATQFNQAANHLAEIQTALTMLPRLEQANINADEEINKLNFEMGRYGSFGFRGSTYRGNNFTDHAQFESLRMRRDTNVAERNSNRITQRRLWEMKPGQNLEKATRDFESQQRDAKAAIEAAREAVASTKREYETLAVDDQVREAVAKLAPARLGPSAEFTANVRELNQFEKSVGARVTKLNSKTKKPH